MHSGRSQASRLRARLWISAYGRGRVLAGLLEAVSREVLIGLAETARHLAQKFGTDSPKVLELAEQEPQLWQPLFEGGAPSARRSFM